MILTFEEYLNDADCPELCNNDSFTLLSPKEPTLNAEDYAYFLAYGHTE
jgi:hypothetical protein